MHPSENENDPCFIIPNHPLLQSQINVNSLVMQTDKALRGTTKKGNGKSKREKEEIFQETNSVVERSS